MASAPRRVWFDQGCEAFKRTRPDLALQVPWEHFYVCPLCLHAFNEEALTSRQLTLEHVPPQSVGGTRLALTCKACNSGSGAQVDNHMKREAHVHEFAVGNLKEIKATIQTASGEAPVRVAVSGSNILMFGVPAATHPDVHKNVMGDFESASVGDGWQDFEFKLQFPEFSSKRAASSWLRSAYLAFFSTLGYHFIFRQELGFVRRRIQNPEDDEPATARILRPETSEPMLIRIDSPATFRSYAMLYGPNVVFLPRYNDCGLYDRLAEHPETRVKFSGIQYPWPVGGPTFFHDRPR